MRRPLEPTPSDFVFSPPPMFRARYYFPPVNLASFVLRYKQEPAPPLLASPQTRSLARPATNMVILARAQGRERAAVPSRSSENWRVANGVP